MKSLDTNILLYAINADCTRSGRHDRMVPNAIGVAPLRVRTADDDASL
ncbi:MAG: hypothetical protein ACOC0O_06050 [Spirochaetota bacterium]